MTQIKEQGKFKQHNPSRMIQKYLSFLVVYIIVPLGGSTTKNEVSIQTDVK